MRVWILFVLTSTMNCYLIGQNALSYQVGISPGYILTGKIKDFKDVMGLTFDLNKTNTGEKYWQADHKYPQMGLRISGTKFKYFQDLSYSIGIVPYLEFNIFKSKAGQLQIKHGTGLAYVFGAFNNVQDQSLGSHLNANSILDIGFNFRKKRKSTSKAGLILSHTSNGNLVQPNSGLNTLSFYVQYNFYPQKQEIELIPYEKINISKKWSSETRISSGLFNYRKEQNKIESDFQITTLITHQHSTRFRSAAGIEIIDISGDLNGTSFALFAEESVCIGHLVTRYGLGYTLFNKKFDESRLYEKVGIAWFPFKLKDEIGKGLSLGADIKAHKFRADYIDVVVGYLF